jgi:hypothetical protein
MSGQTHAPTAVTEGKLHTITIHWGVEVKLYILFTSTLDLGGQTHVPVVLSPGKQRPILVLYETGWAPEVAK